MPIGVVAAVGEAFAAVSAGFAAAGAGVAAGVGLEAGAGAIIGAGLEGAAIGGLGGGALSAIEGKPVLTGALEGAAAGGITGGAVGIGGALGADAGIGGAAGDVIGGAAGGALGAEVTGGNPLVGAVGGAASGGLTASGILSPTPGAATPEAAGSAGGAVGGPGGGAVATAAPASVVPATQDFGTVGNSLADAPAPVSGGDPGAGLTGGGAPPGGGATPPIGSELAPVDTAAVNSQVGLSQTGGTTADGLSIAGHQIPGTNATGSGLSTNASGNPELNTPGAATEAAPGAGGATTSQVSPNVTETTGLGTGGAAGGAKGTTDWANFSNSPFGTVGNALSNNASWLVPVAGLGLAAEKSLGSSLPNQAGLTSSLQGQANTLNANGQLLQSYLQTGQLPPGVQNSITSATKSAQASIRSQYAARGMTGSSAEAQDLANVQQQAAAQGAQIATTLLQAGINETNLSGQIYSELLKTSIAQDSQLESAVGNFASSLVPKAATNVTINQAATG